MAVRNAGSFDRQPISGDLWRENRLAKCVHEIDLHRRGDRRARYTLAAWLDELEAVLALPDDGIRAHSPNVDPEQLPSEWRER
jgi:hypothetical protein